MSVPPLPLGSDHAKLLWKRIPKSVKQSNGEIGELWEIGKRLWRRDFAAVYEPAQNPAWPPHIAPLVASLVGEWFHSPDFPHGVGKVGELSPRTGMICCMLKSTRRTHSYVGFVVA